MRNVVFFDVDGVLIKKQSQKLFVDYLFRKKKVSFLWYVKLILWFSLYKIGLIQDTVKIRNESIVVIKGWNVAETNKIFDNFYLEIIKPNLCIKSVELIRNHLVSGDCVVLISASLQGIVERIARSLFVNYYIATSLETQNDLYTGRIQGVVPFGINKKELAQEFIDRNGFSWEYSYAYADDISDLFILLKASKPVVVNPTRKLRVVALQYLWPVYDF